MPKSSSRRQAPVLENIVAIGSQRKALCVKKKIVLKQFKNTCCTYIGRTISVDTVTLYSKSWKNIVSLASDTLASDISRLNKYARMVPISDTNIIYSLKSICLYVLTCGLSLGPLRECQPFYC